MYATIVVSENKELVSTPMFSTAVASEFTLMGLEIFGFAHIISAELPKMVNPANLFIKDCFIMIFFLPPCPLGFGFLINNRV